MSIFSANYTLNNEGVKDLNKVLFDAVFKFGDLFNTCTPMNGVVNGQKAAYVDKMSDLGWAGRGCNPTYKNPTIGGRENTWVLGNYSVPLKICYDDLKDTIAKWSLKNGTNAEDLSQTDFYDKIFTPLLSAAIERMYWRMSWFADTQAKLASAGGVVKTGTDTTLFTMADGLWKKIFAATSSNKTAIAANAEASKASQLSAIRTDGVAVALIEKVLSDANSLIEDGTLMMTKSVFEALRKDYRREYKSTIPFMQVAEGVQLPTYDGVKILVVPEWDNIIRNYEDNGTKFNSPHRIVFCNPENLLVGTSDKNLFAELTSGFDDKARENYTYLASNIGTLVGNTDLIQAAY